MSMGVKGKGFLFKDGVRASFASLWRADSSLFVRSHVLTPVAAAEGRRQLRDPQEI